MSIRNSLAAACGILALAGAAQAAEQKPAEQKPEAAKGIPAAVVDAYLEIQVALAADSVKGVDAAAARLATESGKAGLAGVEKVAKEFKAPNLADARKAFKPLSDMMVAANKAMPGAQVKTFHCPMAKASWLQRSAPVRNPFYGSGMLECGKQTD